MKTLKPLDLDELNTVTKSKTFSGTELIILREMANHSVTSLSQIYFMSTSSIYRLYHRAKAMLKSDNGKEPINLQFDRLLQATFYIPNDLKVISFRTSYAAYATFRITMAVYCAGLPNYVPRRFLLKLSAGLSNVSRIYKVVEELQKMQGMFHFYMFSIYKTVRYERGKLWFEYSEITEALLSTVPAPHLPEKQE